LPHVQVILGEDIFQILMIGVYVALLTKEIVSPYLQSVHHCR
jgi:hypothetical protein